MPGIYVQDGGQLSNSLGDILGGLAANVSPKGRAEADLLRLQSEKADIDAQNAFQQQRLNEAAVRGLHGPGGVTQTLGMEPTVPGTAAAIAQPPAMTPGPGGRISQIDESQFSPTEAYLANEAYAGRNPLNTNLPALFQTATGGPAANYQTQGDIYKAQHTPLSGAAGTSTFIDPTKGNAPGNVVTFGDPGAVAADTAQLTSAQKDADLRADLAETATQAIGDFQTIKQIYASMIGATDVKSVLSDKVVQWLVDHGVPADQLNDPAQARLAIKQLLASTTKSYLTVAQGDPDKTYRGAVQQAITAMPDPTMMNDQQFNAAIDRMIKVAGRQQAAGGPARTFRTTTPKTSQAMQKYFNDLEAIRRQQEEENRQAEAGGAAGGGGGGGGGEIYVFPDGNTATAEVAAGRVPKGSKIKVGGKIIGTVGD